MKKSSKREYGRASMSVSDETDVLMHGVSVKSQVWMSHGDSILELPEGFEVLATTDSIPVAAFSHKQEITLYMGCSFTRKYTTAPKESRS
ncbi:hypothetical protein LWM68_41800 [Niabella sp. W65]|nr:hypothetical protein [Niabella sp. W65]